MSQKDIYIEKLTQQLEYWKSEIKIQELKAEVLADDIKEQGLQKLDALKQYYDSIEGTLDEWVDASEEAWESIEDMAEQQLSTANGAMKNALDHIKGLFSMDDAPKGQG